MPHLHGLRLFWQLFATIQAQGQVLYQEIDGSYPQIRDTQGPNQCPLNQAGHKSLHINISHDQAITSVLKKLED